MHLVPICAALSLALLPGCERLKEKFAGSDGYVEPERPNDSCDSAQYRRYVGGPADALSDLVFVGPKRVLPPGSAMTMDYNPVRVNFDLDEAGNITRVWCG